MIAFGPWCRNVQKGLSACFSVLAGHGNRGWFAVKVMVEFDLVSCSGMNAWNTIEWASSSSVLNPEREN